MMDNVIDRLYTEWAWRSKNGTPTLNNPEDKAILENLIAELAGEPLPARPLNEISEDYDKHILDSLQLEEMPRAVGSYTVPAGSGDVKVHPKDLEMFKRIFPLAPNQGVGPGELALYWLYQYQKNPVTTVDNRGDAKPDLQIGDKYVEVKAYGKHVGKIKLGKFASQKENLRLLNIIFGISTLSKVLQLDSSAKAITATNWGPQDLKEALGYYLKLKNNEGLLAAAEQFELIRSIADKVEMVNRMLKEPETAEEAASRMIGRIAKAKFETKPGNGNYIASVKPDGDIHFFYIDFKKFEEVDMTDKVAILGGEIAVDFMALFG